MGINHEMKSIVRRKDVAHLYRYKSQLSWYMVTLYVTAKSVLSKQSKAEFASSIFMSQRFSLTSNYRGDNHP